jgi:two-component system sensor histidine kinase AlgZ
MWFFVVGPPFLAVLFRPSELTVTRALGSLVALFLYTPIVGVAVHSLFERVERALSARSVPLVLKVACHGATTALVVGALTLVLAPILTLVSAEAVGHELGILVRGILVSYAYLGLASFIGILQRRAVQERARAHAEQVAALEARLRALHAQTHPHFLLNSLNLIASLVHEKPAEAERVIECLGELLHYSLSSASSRVVALAREIAIVRDYLEIQRARFGERLGVRISIEPGTEQCSVPPMLVQTLVENAVLHGLGSRAEGGTVAVSSARRDGMIEIRVEDDGIGLGRSARQGTGTGLRSVSERLAYAFGDAARFEVSEAEPHGTLCRVTIPEARPA